MSDLNLTSAQVVPGFYGKVDYNANGGGQSADLNRQLIWAFVAAGAQATVGLPFLPASQSDMDAQSGDNGSDASRSYAAAVSQPEAQGAEIWVMPIAEPVSGVASSYTFTVLLAAANPAKSGQISLWVASRPAANVAFTTTDTPTTIAAAIAAALNATAGLPLGTVTAAAGVLTVPYVHKGATGEDLPVRCNVQPAATGVQLSAGSATFTGTAGAAGSAVFKFGAISVSTAIASADTNTAVATKVAATFAAGTYPLTAAVDGTTASKVNFFFANNKDVRRITGQILTTTTTTVNLGSGATDGTGSANSTTYNGVTGVGAPDLTTAMTNLAALDPFRSWSAPWVDSATISTMATAIENASDGSITGQKQQILTLCDWRDSATAGLLAPACSPNLTATAPHYAILHAPDAPVQGMELAARAAAARAAFAIDTPQFNWNGWAFKGNVNAPILLPPTKMSLAAQNTDLRTYGLAPVVVGRSGNLEVVKGRTTSLATDLRLWAWSTEAQAAYHAVDLAEFFYSLFNGGNIVRFSEPKAPGIFDDTSFASATQQRMRFWELQGNYDGADLLAPAVQASYDANNPFRVNVEWPESPVLDLDQVVFTSHFSSPSS